MPSCLRNFQLRTVGPVGAAARGLSVPPVDPDAVVDSVFSTLVFLRVVGVAAAGLLSGWELVGDIGVAAAGLLSTS